MNSIVLTESKNGNKYLYKYNSKQLHNIDDTIYNVIDLLLKSNIKNSKEYNSFFLENDKLTSTEIERIKFYIDENTQINEQINTNITEEVIKYYLSNQPQISFEVTEKCNLDCKYCTYGDFYEGHDPRKNRDITIDSAKKLINYIFNFCNSNYSGNSNNVINVTFYGGEPLLRFDFIKEIILYTKSIETDSIKFEFGMTTNATLLYKYIDFFKKYKFDILISIDGNIKNNAYRLYKNGKQSFDDVFNNILLIKKEHPKYFNEKIKINSVLHNKNSVAEINDFVKKHFDKNPMIAELSTDGLKEKKKDELQKLLKNKYEDLNQSEDYYKSFHDTNLLEVPDFKEAVYFISNLSNLVYSSHTELLYGNSKIIKPTGTCLPFSRKIFVTASGKILACENIPHKYTYGSVSNNGVDIDLKKITDDYNEYLNKMKKKCSNCYRITNCSQCMFYLNLEEEKPNCYGFMNKKEFSKYLSRIITYLENNPEVFSKIINETTLT